MQVIFEYITTDSIKVDNRLAATLILKNLIKKIYGVSEHNSERIASWKSAASVHTKIKFRENFLLILSSFYRQ